MKFFKEISSKDTKLAGGKGASLGELTQAGIQVPPGFVIPSDVFNKFIESNHLVPEIDAILSKVDIQSIHTVNSASEKIQELILAVQFPENLQAEVQTAFDKLDAEFVAVRSSATAEDSASAAWAGQLETYLNTTQADLFDNIKKCWASLFTPRAIFYRFEKQLHSTDIAVAVVVQKMVQSQISGIAFSVHPVTQDHNQIIIEAGYGLGEAIVSGQITPDSYVVEKKPHAIIDKQIANQTKGLFKNGWQTIQETKAQQQKLSDEQILELSTVIQNIEKHYGFPCDIEWAFADNQFYITQSRPITTLKDTNPQNKSLQKALHTEWQKDWEGPFSILQLSFSKDVYFDKPQELFGTQIPTILLTIENGITAAYLPVKEYEEFGTYLADKLLKDPSLIAQWAENFKLAADKLTLKFKISAEELQQQSAIEELLQAYTLYGAYQVACKAAVNFLHQDIFEEASKAFEEARKYSETIYKDAEKLNNILISISQTQYSDAQLYGITLTELLSNDVDKTILEKRHKKSAVVWTKDGFDFLYENDVDSIKKSWIADLSGDSLKGTPAFEGVIKGKCKIIHDFNDAQINQGEILVTGMTDPNAVPLMKKAAAIITDAGGMLCHAAIVSRELEIPCIVGTKVATQILTDGMQVEVDANIGLITILNKN